ncbi:MAG: hypothetical protein JWP34_5255, partial [Massilia sp.]|nr:hypothetical protein [Massilia sp.]
MHYSRPEAVFLTIANVYIGPQEEVLSRAPLSFAATGVHAAAASTQDPRRTGTVVPAMVALMLLKRHRV